MALHRDDPFLAGEHLLGVGNLVEPQLLGHLGTHLCGVTVDGLTAADDEVGIGHYMLDGCGQGIAGGQGVGSCKSTVGEQIASVRTAVHGFSDYLGRTAGTHGDDDDGGAGVLVLQAQCLLQSVQILGIEDGRQCRAVDRALWCHGIGTHVACVGDLLGKYNNFQIHKKNVYLMIIIGL